MMPRTRATVVACDAGRQKATLAAGIQVQGRPGIEGAYCGDRRVDRCCRVVFWKAGEEGAGDVCADPSVPPENLTILFFNTDAAICCALNSPSSSSGRRPRHHIPRLAFCTAPRQIAKPISVSSAASSSWRCGIRPTMRSTAPAMIF